MTGFGTALRLALRRNLVFYLCWIAGLAMLLPATVTKYHDLVPDGPSGAVMLAQLAANPTMRAILGPAIDLTTAGGFTFWRVGTFTAAGAAMMAALGVIRATRDEEENGRVELIRSGAVSRAVPLAAGLALAVAASLFCGAVIGASMAALAGVAGGWASGLGIGLTGAMFAAVAAVVAQVFESSRTARAWSVGVLLGGLYLARALVDGSRTEPDAWTWAMPLDWAALARPYAGERWWVLALPAAVTIVLSALAFRLEALRDHGAGLRQPSLGAADAAPYLRDARGLSWRLQRGGIVGWTIAIVVSALSMGSLSLSMGSLLEGQDALAEMLRRLGGGAGALQAAFFAAMLSIMATVVTLSGVLVLGRLRQEETAGRAEVMLATATSRWAYALSTLVPAVLLPAGLLVATGALLPIAQAQHDGSPDLIGTYTQAACALLPGVVLVLGLAMFLIGWLPRWFGLSWAVVGWTIVVSWLLPLFDVPDWLLKLQPWGHLPHLPADEMTWGAFSVTLAAGAVLLVLGAVGYRRRDIYGR
ncbi:ABC transporter permease [Propionicicella superfundia]|uniref:ABC transporter permease n=1 Tax=Propionicicella superfundia TaxID=348582 RepID=UPI0003FE1924|nr:hypothetical protein [Propionicicella superfundia]